MAVLKFLRLEFYVKILNNFWQFQLETSKHLGKHYALTLLVDSYFYAKEQRICKNQNLKKQKRLNKSTKNKA
jgi:hypothetical protein